MDCDTQENCFLFFVTGKDSNTILPTNYERISHTTWEKYQKLTENEKENFDYILFDLPPAISEKVQTILGQSDVVYVPTMLGEFEISGLKKVTNEINRQGVRLGGVFVTMYNAHNDAEIIGDFRNILQERLMKTVIPYSKTVRESQKAGLPIEEYFLEKGVPKNKNSWKVVNAYEELSEEIIKGE